MKIERFVEFVETIVIVDVESMLESVSMPKRPL